MSAFRGTGAEADPGPGRLERPGLARRIAGALNRGSLLVVAPAGYGKTTALEEALELEGRVAAWVRCREVDRDPGKFLEQVVGKLRVAAPGVADRLADRIAAGNGPIDVGHATRELGEELERLLVDPLTIVIDDAERLSRSPDAASIIAGLLASEACPLGVAVASRTPLPLRIAKLRAAGSLVELGSADLAFTVEDCAEMLRAQDGREHLAGEAEALWTATEGWPLGVAMATRSQRPLTALEPGFQALADYLSEEVLDVLEPELRTALIDSSVAEELDLAVAQALGLPEGFLGRVRDLGIPQSSSSGRTETFSYHPLVREVLAERLLDERSEARRAELHAGLAEWLEGAGCGPDTVEHWLRAGNRARAVAAVSQHGPDLIRTAPTTVAGWLRRLPPEARETPELRLLEGRLEGGSGRLEEAIAPLREAVAGYAARGDVEAEWSARLALAETCVIQERFELVVPLSEGFEASPAAVAPAVAMSAASALAGLGRYAEASELYERAAMSDEATAPLVRGMHGFWVDLQCGRLDVAHTAVSEAMAQLERADPLNHLPYLTGMLAVVEEERGLMESALSLMVGARELADRTVLGGYISDAATRFAAGVKARAGRLEEAERDLAEVTGPGLGWYAGDAELTRATIASKRGEPGPCRDAVVEAFDRGALEPWRARSRATALLVPVLARIGQEAWALELVEDALALRPPLASSARLRALRGWLRGREGDVDGAVADLAIAWSEAGAEAAHLLRREHPRLGRLLWSAVEVGAIDPDAAVAALAAAGADSALAWTRHPLARARRAAILVAAGSGHPDAADRIDELAGDPTAEVASAARAARRRLISEPPPLVITLLGGFELRRGAYVLGDDVWGPRRRSAQRLVRYLLIHRESAVPEEDLFEAFWPGVPADVARRRLQVTVSSARAVLEHPVGQQAELKHCDRTYRLVLGERDVIDADVFDRAAAAALEPAGGGPRLRALELAVARWGGEPLPEDRYEGWATSWRERLLDLYAQTLGALADASTAAGNHAAAIDASSRQVELDPLDEGAHRRLMLTYARSGRRGHALRQYLACRRALVETLGIEPGEETTALQRRILAGERV